MAQEHFQIRGEFTLEKYDASAEKLLEVLQHDGEEQLARIRFQEVLAANAPNAESCAYHTAEAATLRLALLDWQREFQETYAKDVTTFSNGPLNAGITLLWQLLSGASSVHFDNTNSRIQIGTSNTAYSAAQTGVQTLLATLVMDTGYPIVSAQSITWRATASTATANGSWQEAAVTNGTTALNRAVSNQGTKTSSDIWVPSLTITLA